jgi:secreted trypsin-like serine protease
VRRAFGSTLLVCTATALSSRVLVTAAHCVSGPQARRLEFTRSPDATTAPESESVHVRRAFVHPSYDLASRGSLHDVALVELDSPLEGVAGARVPSRATGEVLAPGGHVELVGYGRTPSGVLGHRHVATGTIVSVGPDEMTIGAAGEEQSCVGDSGGPVFVVGEDGSRQLVGVVSRSASESRECEDGSVDSRVDVYAGWIGETLEAIGSP